MSKPKVPPYVAAVYAIAKKHGVEITASIAEAMIEAQEAERKRWVYCPQHGDAMKPVVFGETRHFMCTYLGCGFELKSGGSHD